MENRALRREGQRRVRQVLHRIAQLAGTGNVRKSGGKFATGELGESTERTQIPHLRSRHSWERDSARRAAGGERACGEREGRACEEALRGTRRPAYAPEAAMPRGAAHMPGSLRARGLVPGAGSPQRPWAPSRRGRRLRAAPATALALPPMWQRRLPARACPRACPACACGAWPAAPAPGAVGEGK